MSFRIFTAAGAKGDKFVTMIELSEKELPSNQQEIQGQNAGDNGNAAINAVISPANATSTAIARSFKIDGSTFAAELEREVLSAKCLVTCIHTQVYDKRDHHTSLRCRCCSNTNVLTNSRCAIVCGERASCGGMFCAPALES